MSKNLLNKQIQDSFYGEEYYPAFVGDEPCLDPDCVDDEVIYDMIEDDDSDINMNELELDDYDDYMEL